MGLTRNPNVFRLSPEDPLAGYLKEKLTSGNGIKITVKTVGGVGDQFVFNVVNDVVGSSGEVYEAKEDFVIPYDASMVLVNASENGVRLTLPEPSEFIGWLSIVCVDNSNPIALHTPEEDVEAVVVRETEDEDGPGDMVCDSSDRIFDKSNIEFHSAGDSLIFASNRKDTWYCISKYTADWYR